MSELVFATEALNAARSFLQLDLRTQWSYRTTLSRLYYAAHHLGRLLLRNAGLTPHLWRRDVHDRVIKELHRHYVLTGMMSRGTLHALRRLHGYRIQADYDLTIAIQPTQVSAAINLFMRYSNECYRILGVI
jgi:uncharacterized protein (UPF0332 family)